MVDPITGSTAVIEPPVIPPPAATSPATPPAASPATPPPAVPPATPPAEPPVIPPAMPPAPSAGAPFELEVPKDGLLTKDYVAQFQKDAIAAGLSKDEAKDLLDTQYKAVKDFQDRNQQSIESAKTTWAEESKKASDIGGDNFNRTAEMSKRVVQAFDTNGEMAKLMTDTGFGNYHAVLRFLSKIGNVIGEDSLKAGSASSGGAQKSREDKLFPSTAGVGV